MCFQLWALAVLPIQPFCFSLSVQCSISYIRFNCCSVAQLCPTLCNPMDCSMPGFPVLHSLAEFAQTHVHWVNDAIQLSHPLSSLLLLPSAFPSIRVFSMGQLFASGGQSFGASDSQSVLIKNIQDSYLLGWTGLILQSKGLSKVFSNTTVQKHQFSGAQPSLWSSSHICTWLLGKPECRCRCSHSQLMLVWS